MTHGWVVLALWCSLLVAACGAALWAGELGVGLLVGGVSTAGVLLWLVDPADPPPTKGAP